MRILPIAAIIAAAPLCAQVLVLQPAPGAKATETRTLPLAAGAPLKVKNVNGRIHVTGWDRPEVEFTGAFTPGRGQEQVKVVLESKDGGLEIRGEYPRNTSNGPVVEMDLKVPRSALPTLETVNGEVLLKDVAGKATCRSVNGGIVLEGAAGALTLETVNGGIQGRGLGEVLSARTVNGSIRLSAQGLKGRVVASTLNGSLRIKSEGAKDVQVSRRRFEATFGAGGNEMKLKTVNGDITLD
jgi:RNase P/RNase MRP subunit p29